jgi:hypothetical protein
MNNIEKEMIKAKPEAVQVLVKNSKGKYVKRWYPVLGLAVIDNIFITKNKTRAKKYARDIKEYLKGK